MCYGQLLFLANVIANNQRCHFIQPTLVSITQSMCYGPVSVILSDPSHAGTVSKRLKVTSWFSAQMLPSFIVLCWNSGISKKMNNRRDTPSEVGRLPRQDKTTTLFQTLNQLIFTARRNARIASALPAIAFPSVCPSVCPSVPPSVTRRYCVKTTARVARCSLTVRQQNVSSFVETKKYSPWTTPSR